jgi:putative flippase GtrA
VSIRLPARRPRISPVMVRYIGVGVLSLVIDAGSLWLLYNVFHRPLWLATTTGFWLSFAVNFLVNKYFTFGARTNGTAQLLRYGVLVVLNYGANLGIVTGLAGLGVPAVAAKVFAVALLTGLNFIAYRRWVFRS